MRTESELGVGEEGLKGWAPGPTAHHVKQGGGG